MTSNLHSLRLFVSSESGLPALIGIQDDDDDDTDDDSWDDSDTVPTMQAPLEHITFGESVAFIVGALFLVGRIVHSFGWSR